MGRHNKKWQSMPSADLIHRIKRCHWRMNRGFCRGTARYWRWSDYQMHLLNELQWRAEH